MGLPMTWRNRQLRPEVVAHAIGPGEYRRTLSGVPAGTRTDQPRAVTPRGFLYAGMSRGKVLAYLTESLHW